MEVDLVNTYDMVMMMMIMMMLIMMIMVIRMVVMIIAVTQSIFKIGPPDFAWK